MLNRLSHPGTPALKILIDLRTSSAFTHHCIFIFQYLYMISLLSPHTQIDTTTIYCFSEYLVHSRLIFKHLASNPRPTSHQPYHCRISGYIYCLIFKKKKVMIIAMLSSQVCFKDKIKNIWESNL